MLGNLLAPPDSYIVATTEQTTINSRTTVLGSLVFCTLAFLVFFVVEFEEASKKLGVILWWVTFAAGSLSLFVGFSRLRDVRSLMVISKDGISFPRMFTDVLPWSAISEIKFTGSFLTLNFKEELRLKWFPKFTLVPGDPGFAGDGFFSNHYIPWVKVRVNYQWPVNTATLRKLIDERKPK